MVLFCSPIFKKLFFFIKYNEKFIFVDSSSKWTIEYGWKKCILITATSVIKHKHFFRWQKYIEFLKCHILMALTILFGDKMLFQISNKTLHTMSTQIPKSNITCVLKTITVRIYLRKYTHQRRNPCLKS